MIQGKTTFENQWRRRDCCKWGAWANSISIAQELLRRATARATPHTYCIWSCILTRYTSEFQKHRCRTENQCSHLVQPAPFAAASQPPTASTSSSPPPVVLTPRPPPGNMPFGDQPFLGAQGRGGMPSKPTAFSSHFISITYSRSVCLEIYVECLLCTKLCVSCWTCHGDTPVLQVLTCPWTFRQDTREPSNQLLKNHKFWGHLGGPVS